jgi:lipid-A-disaccharide synthase
MLYHVTPAVIGYRVGRLAYWLQNRFRTVKYITLANLLDLSYRCGGEAIFCKAGESSSFTAAAEAAIYPEFLACDDKSEEIAGKVVQWLRSKEQQQTVVRRLHDLRQAYAKPGASVRAADYILQHLFTHGSESLRSKLTDEPPSPARAAG